MAELHSGNLRTVNLLSFVKSEVNRLREGILTPRSMRQILDADNFIKMVKSPPYCRAATVGELKQIISEKRDELSENIQVCETQLEGYQFTLFDEISDEPTEDEKKEMKALKESMEEERKWLHKCLGICASKSYFN